MKYALLEVTEKNAAECKKREITLANVYFADPYKGNCPRRATEIFIDNPEIYKTYEKYMKDRPECAKFKLSKFTSPKRKKKVEEKVEESTSEEVAAE